MNFGEVELICHIPLLVELVVLLELKIQLPLILFLLFVILEGAHLQFGFPKCGVNRLQILESFCNVCSILQGLSDMIDDELCCLVEVMGLLGSWDEIATVLKGLLGV